ncbi:MAG: hypothetical protein ACYSYT_07235, partial [Planctomycetota bacterium]
TLKPHVKSIWAAQPYVVAQREAGLLYSGLGYRALREVSVDELKKKSNCGRYCGSLRMMFTVSQGCAYE